ncbi:hypothetical protein ACQ33O_03330 [Ferruginibacter sp. SUN002]|uniref:hypothetical protein n=1 Tax=Ferruginibacter sp. SUN002 TaxID=2937789 RepID=UPI003D360A4D
MKEERIQISKETIERIGKSGDYLRKLGAEAISSMEQTSVILHQVYKEIAKFGWYTNATSSIIDLVPVKAAIRNKNTEEINRLMIAQTKEYYTINKKHTLETFSAKKEILSRAFKAFEKKQYEYSILLFLTQTDSICKALIGTRLFGKRSKQPKTKEFADQHYNERSFISAVLQPLTDYGEINKVEQDYLPGELNRHRVIHGEDTEYGNVVNAHKILSLIFYLTTLVGKISTKPNVA